MRSARLSRTDAIQKAVASEIAKHQVWLDADGVAFRSVTLSVKFVRDTGMPRVVIVTTETESD